MAKSKSDIGYAAVHESGETVWPFRGQLHGSANLARNYLTSETFPNHDHGAMWQKLRNGGWRIAKIKIMEVAK